MVPEIDRSLFDRDAMLLCGDEAYVSQYFRVGKQAWDIIQWALSTSKGRNTPKDILDLPCGAGRITRWLRATWPDARIFVSDISDDEMRFCAEHFSGLPVKAHNDFSKINIPSHVDVVWCGSLITHIDAKRTSQLLNWFMEQLNPGGVLIATTHGRQRIKLLEKSPSGLSADQLHKVLSDYHEYQFGHHAYNINSQGYGFSLTSLQWLASWIENRKDAKLIALQEAAWADRQDVLIVQKTTI
ncbi:hypothetical protein DESC_290072 [Desulfosarcina cetonica]|uniref:class I SAM-dependent methyltransferase n=1 Tax=Desulfosarcina cetonica TaxID=90730 RepID=UPI0006D0584F|nr:class I SAM-dependent methyltransferase [Desulfosarcina cetonica]VTR65002.1 hypothetical protein DESC_290072 [Desulfosarcina cetonica]